MKNNRKLTKDEEYTLGFMEGARIGRILQFRDILIKAITHTERKRDKNYKPSKELLKKINREVDFPLMCKLINVIMNGKMSASYLEAHYDRLFLCPGDLGKLPPDREFDSIPLQNKAGDFLENHTA